PLLTCVRLGSRRVCSGTQLLPLRRTPIWIAFGSPISPFPELRRSEARERIGSELAAAFNNLYAELRRELQLTSDALPHSPRERMKHCRASSRRGDLAVTGISNRSGWHANLENALRRFASGTVDSLLCAS